METDFINACNTGVCFKVICRDYENKTFRWNKDKHCLEVYDDVCNEWYITNASVSIFQPYVIIVDKPFKKVKRTFEEAVNILKYHPKREIFVNGLKIKCFMGMLVYENTSKNVRDKWTDYGLISLEFIEYVPS